MLTRLYSDFSPLTRLHSEMNRLIEHFFEDMPETRPYGTGYPALNMWEDGDNAYIECELPGLTLDDIEVLVSGSDVTLKGTRKIGEHQNASWHRRERAQGSFARTLTLPWEVDSDKVTATFRDGVLIVQLPRAESAKPKKVKVLT